MDSKKSESSSLSKELEELERKNQSLVAQLQEQKNTFDGAQNKLLQRYFSTL